MGLVLLLILLNHHKPKACGLFIFEKNMTDQERIKRLEENVSWLQRDIDNLINIIKNLKKPEVHTHYTLIQDNRPCTDCKEEESTNLEDFI
jgi:hypothetical protein